ncbi:MAG TPA: arylamine N-acetyltransferase, partial [Rhizomicrobium sp.]
MPTLDTLRAIHLLHPRAIPFENLDVLLRRGVRLDTDSLQAKLVEGGRGGYCFEHNMLLSFALRALGFDVTQLTGRIRYGVPDGVMTPLTHMLLKVDLGGAPFLVDVGFGGNTLTAPLRLDEAAEQATPHEPFRLTSAGGRYLAEAKLRGAWVPLYSFALEPQHAPDIELGNWFMATHPKSRFYEELVVARVTPEGRLALHNNQLAIHFLNGTSERRVLQSLSELRDALTGLLGLTLPD